MSSDRDQDASWLCPVWGVNAPSSPIRVLGVLDPPHPTIEFILVSMSDDDRTRLNGVAAHLPVSSMQLHDARAAISTNAPAIFGTEPVRSVGLQICALTLSLWCEGIAIPFCFLTRGGPAEYPGVSWASHDPFLPGVAYRQQHLDENAAASVPVVASRISGQFQHLAGTVMRFYWAGHKAFHLDAILDYAIAAEALLCRGATGQISAKFRRRAARLLSSEIDKDGIAKRADDIYNLRSKLVHGDDASLQQALKPWGGDERIARQDVRAFARDVLLAALRDPDLMTSNGLERLDG